MGLNENQEKNGDMKFMDKITDTNIIETLREIMETNTVYYKTDFDIYVPHIQAAAEQNDYREKSLLWLSYPSGIVCDSERNVLQQNTYGHNSWRFYHEQTRDRILAYAVDIKNIDKDGNIMGDISELDYHKHAVHVRDVSVPSDYYTVTFKNGVTEKVLKPDFNYENYDMREVSHTRSEPNDPGALDALLEQEYENRLIEPYNITSCYYHTERLKDDHAQFEAKRITAELNKIKQPNTPDKKSFRVQLSMYYTENPPRDELKRLFKAMPYKTMKICRFSDIDGTYATVDKHEIMSNRKPSLIGELKDNLEAVKKSQSIGNINKSKNKSDLEV